MRIRHKYTLTLTVKRTHETIVWYFPSVTTVFKEKKKKKKKKKNKKTNKSLLTITSIGV